MVDGAIVLRHHRRRDVLAGVVDQRKDRSVEEETGTVTDRRLDLFQHAGKRVKVHAAQAGFTLCGRRVNGQAWRRLGELLKIEDITCGTCLKSLAKQFWKMRPG